MKARGPVEDSVFALDISIMKNVRRGNTILVTQALDGKDSHFEIARKGLPKFFDLKIEYIDPETRYNEKTLSAVERGIKNYQLAGPLKVMLKGHKVEIVKTVKANGENA